MIVSDPTYFKEDYNTILEFVIESITISQVYQMTLLCT